MIYFNEKENVQTTSQVEEKAQETVRKALAVGADRGIHIKTDSYVEPLGVAKILKKIVEKENNKNIDLR